MIPPSVTKEYSEGIARHRMVHGVFKRSEAFATAAPPNFTKFGWALGQYGHKLSQFFAETLFHVLLAIRKITQATDEYSLKLSAYLLRYSMPHIHSHQK